MSSKLLFFRHCLHDRITRENYLKMFPVIEKVLIDNSSRNETNFQMEELCIWPLFSVPSLSDIISSLKRSVKINNANI